MSPDGSRPAAPTGPGGSLTGAAARRCRGRRHAGSTTAGWTRKELRGCARSTAPGGPAMAARRWRHGWPIARCSAGTGSTCGRCRCRCGWRSPAPSSGGSMPGAPRPARTRFRALLRKLAASGASSLLDRPADDWNARLGFSSRHGDSERRFLLDAVGYLRDLAEGAGWDTEYPRDVWLLRRLGYPGRDAVLRFDRIEAAWLRELAKRWARWRLSTGTALATVLADVRAITRSARSFPSLQRGPEALTRELIEVHPRAPGDIIPEPQEPHSAGKGPSLQVGDGGQGQDRTADLPLFRRSVAFAHRPGNG